MPRTVPAGWLQPGSSRASRPANHGTVAVPARLEEDEEPLTRLFTRAGGWRRHRKPPLSQRHFTILGLRGVVFSVTTTEFKRRPVSLQNVTPGTHPPFITSTVKSKQM